MSIFKGIKPEKVWQYFEEICQVPRPSKKEEKIIEFLLDFGRKHTLDTKRDEIGNVLISKPATKGKENVPTVVLQSHIDMVCEKNSDVAHDFEKDPIKPYIEGDWVKAKGTTLGADDGIGMAAQMAVLTSDDIAHGPVECLFTVDEETGLTGAFELQPGFFKGRILLNLDSEDEGELFIGCAGGVDTLASMEFKKKDVPKDHIACRIVVNGLTGGHSGDDIHKGRGNANKILNRFLWETTYKYKIRITDFDGGNLRNAIAREANAIITINRKRKDDFMKFFIQFSEEVKKELAITEPNLAMKIEPVDNPDFVMNRKAQHRLVNSLYSCPHGVIEWSHEIDGLVETSTNLASVKCKKGKINITTSQRSSVDTAKRDIANMVESTFLLADANVKHTDGYPGWQPNPESKILKITEAAYQRLFDQKPIVRAIHAGLECGLFLEKYPDMDMISFGPTIWGAHSPDERINIETTMKFWKLLVEILEKVE